MSDEKAERGREKSSETVKLREFVQSLPFSRNRHFANISLLKNRFLQSRMHGRITFTLALSRAFRVATEPPLKEVEMERCKTPLPDSEEAGLFNRTASFWDVANAIKPLL